MENWPQDDEKLDRRVTRTRKAIMDAFDKLLAEGDNGKMTVSAIAQEANIDRKTFYLHYDSIEDLVNHKVEGGLVRLIAAIKQQGIEEPSAESLHIALQEANSILVSDINLYEHIAKLLTIDQLLGYCGSVIAPIIEQSQFSPDLVDNRKAFMRMQFYTAGALSLYITWLRSGHVEPIETISDAIERAVRYD